ncbi:hypothetical protein F130042H8_12610 [Enterocloster alcoholdehydrogenati]|uniref:Uncharacterized protein n=1 Tax=Enterocloster alcoholdehydrogenati TaxID=2547410 RepID=A0ABQ0AW03_9FIRM
MTFSYSMVTAFFAVPNHFNILKFESPYLKQGDVGKIYYMGKYTIICKKSAV